MATTKIFNDPVYGFVTIPSEFIFQIIEHSWFQRLRRIQQLGLTSYVYPGALNTRFQHAIGAMHLMEEGIKVLRGKGHDISNSEAEAALVAILLHDIGHGPYSHTLERTLISEVSHEGVGLAFMRRLNVYFNGGLDLAIRIFRKKYERPFLHQMVSSQLDMDRLDYLVRDSYFTGVSEGIIGVDRIIKMLNVSDNELVFDAKGIYSIEKFLVARRIMYWQVYLHKNVVVAEQMLSRALSRARELTLNGSSLHASPALQYFLQHTVDAEMFRNDPTVLETYAQLDDVDIMSAVKEWTKSSDPILAELCQRIMDRRLLRIEVLDGPPEEERLADLRAELVRRLGVDMASAAYLVFHENTTAYGYTRHFGNIRIRYKDGQVSDLTEASGHLSISLTMPEEKHFLCYPKELDALAGFTKPKK